MGGRKKKVDISSSASREAREAIARFCSITAHSTAACRSLWLYIIDRRFDHTHDYRQCMNRKKKKNYEISNNVSSKTFKLKKKKKMMCVYNIYIYVIYTFNNTYYTNRVYAIICKFVYPKCVLFNRRGIVRIYRLLRIIILYYLLKRASRWTRNRQTVETRIAIVYDFCTRLRTQT